MVPIFKFLLSCCHQNNDNKVISCQLQLTEFKTKFALMMPIKIFLILSGNQNNDNKVTPCQLCLAEFTLMVPILLNVV